MNWKAIGIVALKNAIAAILMAGAPIWQDPHSYNLTTTAGLSAVGKMLGWAVVVREGMVWGPRLLKWVNSPTPGDEQ